MTPDQAFLADICANPDDDAPRLIYADWLDEHGQEERAEFIRVQCELAKLLVEPEPARYLECLQCNNRRHGRASTNNPCQCHPTLKALRRRETELLLCRIDGGWSGHARFAPAWFRDVPGLEWQFRRGFIEEISLPCEAWVGRKCPTCNHQNVVLPRSRCPFCQLTGRVDAHGPALVKVAPLRVVRLTDREPRVLGLMENPAAGNIMERWYWIEDASFPAELLNAANGSDGHPTHEAALDAHSKACLAWANRRLTPVPV